MTVHIIVTDGEQRSSLAAVRSLGRAGHRVHVCSSRKRCLAGASRYATAVSQTVSPLRDPEGFRQSVTDIAVAQNATFVIPMTDQSVIALLSAGQRLGPASIPFPPFEAYRQLSDKAWVATAARQLGIAVPSQTTIREPADWDRLDWNDVSFPMVLKPSQSVRRSADGAVKLGVRYASDRGELDRVRELLIPEDYPLLAQQRIVGDGVGVFLLRWNGEILASFAHRRIREKPPSGGVSVYRESIAAPADLRERCATLLEQVGWQGVAMVEFKREQATGTPYVMEINGRFWGSLQLAIDAGVDFPALVIQAALGNAVEPIHDYRVGVRSRWWWGDVDHLFIRLRRSKAELALEPSAYGRGRAVLEFLKLRVNDREEILRITDPVPFLRESLDWLRRQ